MKLQRYGVTITSIFNRNIIGEYPSGDGDYYLASDVDPILARVEALEACAELLRGENLSRCDIFDALARLDALEMINNV